MKIFYYDRCQLFYAVLLNVFLLGFCICAGHYCPKYLWVISLITVVCLVSFSASLYVFLFPQKLAIIDDEGIIIDHNAKLLWRDVAEIKKIWVSGLLGRKIIRFDLKADVSYPLTIMQKISKKSEYGAFSIPLYAMQEEDAAVVEQLIDHFVAKNKSAD